MKGTLFGLETELAFSVGGEGASPEASGEKLLREFFCLAEERLPSLRGEKDSDLFLANGSRLYLDCFTHPELCTPECRSPAEVVCWQLAGEQLLADLAGELEKRHPGVSVSLFRCNVDYAGTGATWGCHESYQHTSSAQELAPKLIPHLVTRIVYTGAGGFDNRKDDLAFLLSPRVPHLVHEVQANGSSERGIYHLKDEPLAAGGFHRLHLVCGESLCSQLSNYLKVATTALIVRLIDAGVCRGDRLTFRSALAAMATFAQDPRCRERADLADGRSLTAVDVQAQYLAMVEEHLGADFMPAWAPDVCRRWRYVLEQLVSQPASLASSLDWMIKRALFEDYVKRAGASWGELRRGVGVGTQLCEIDTRFGELGERAIFHALDRAGAIDHRLPELGSVDEAMRKPPPGGRAAVRGRAIARLAPQRHRYLCSWEGIVDVAQGRILDLSDPFATAPRWKRRTSRPRRESPADRRHRQITRQIDQAYFHYDQMECEQAVTLLDGAMRAARGARDREREALARFWCASAHHDLAELDAAEAALAPVLEDDVSGELRCRLWTRLALIRIERPSPRSAIDEAIEAAREAQRTAGGNVGCSRITLLDALLLGVYEQWQAAIATMERALREAASDPRRFGFGSYLRWLVAFAFKLGDLDRARSFIEQWQNTERSHGGIPVLCAQAQLGRREGRAADSIQLAAEALDRSSAFPRHRTRLEALLTFAECAYTAGDPECAQPFLGALRGWREVEIGALRREVERIEWLLDGEPLLAQNRQRGGE